MTDDWDQRVREAGAPRADGDDLAQLEELAAQHAHHPLALALRRVVGEMRQLRRRLEKLTDEAEFTAAQRDQAAETAEGLRQELAEAQLRAANVESDEDAAELARREGWE